MRIHIHTHTHTHTLDKNGSLYDPAGTESWNMQIRYETTKLTMHPTNNGSSPEWFRRNNPENQNYNRRRGFGEIQEGSFWCSRTNHKWPKLIPDCDNSAANCVTWWLGFWAWPLAIPEKIRTAGTSPGVPGDILGSYEELRWMEPHMSSPSPCVELSIRKREDKGRKRERNFTSI